MASLRRSRRPSIFGSRGGMGFFCESSPIFTRATYKRAKDRNPDRTISERIAGLRSIRSIHRGVLDRFANIVTASFRRSKTDDSHGTWSVSQCAKMPSPMAEEGPVVVPMDQTMRGRDHPPRACRQSFGAGFRLATDRSILLVSSPRGLAPVWVPIDLAGSITGFVLPRLRELINLNASPTVTGLMKPDPGRETPNSGPE
jgi:hypothetical protein